MYSSVVFAGGRLLCTQILPGQGRPPATILYVRIRKLGTPGYPMVKTASPRFDTMPESHGVQFTVDWICPPGHKLASLKCVSHKRLFVQLIVKIYGAVAPVGTRH